MVPCVARLSTAIVLNMKDKQVHVSNEDKFQLPVQHNKCW